MRIGIYGNNLNVGYFFAREFSRFGLDAVLFRFQEDFAQDRPEWWGTEIDESLMTQFGRPVNAWSVLPLKADAQVRALYASARRCDALFFMQDGPAVFSSLKHANKVFVSQGGDLQNFPFALEQYFNRASARSVLTGAQRTAISGSAGGSRTFARRVIDGSRSVQKHALRQVRQRRGLRQCRAWICTPNQAPLVDRLGYDTGRVTYLPLPYFGDADNQDSVDRNLMARLSAFTLVFVHPTRQMFLPLDGNPYVKGNDKLIEGFAQFVKVSRASARLLLVRKGRPADIAEAERKIREFDIGDHVEWFDEISNTVLRGLYQLPNAVVCDQFDPSTGYLGSIGREASVFGCPLITCFEPNNALFFGQDMPAHVFPSKTSGEITRAMHTLAGFSPDAMAVLRDSAKAWSSRRLLPDALIPRFIDVLTPREARL